MARIARVVAPNWPHHITQRGNRRQPTFFCDDDYAIYKMLLAEQAKLAGVSIWGWCLMPNHVHLILVPANRDSLTVGMRETHRRYTRHINFREKWRGYLWQGRFSSCVMDETHLLAGLRYVDLNPVRAKLCKTPRQWKWSSAKAHLTGKSDNLTDLKALSAIVDDWKNLLSADANEEAYEALRAGERTGRPLMDNDQLNQLETLLGRSLKRQKPGPKPKFPQTDQKM